MQQGHNGTGQENTNGNYAARREAIQRVYPQECGRLSRGPAHHTPRSRMLVLVLSRDPPVLARGLPVRSCTSADASDASTAPSSSPVICAEKRANSRLDQHVHGQDKASNVANHTCDTAIEKREIHQLCRGRHNRAHAPSPCEWRGISVPAPLTSSHGSQTRTLHAHKRHAHRQTSLKLQRTERQASAPACARTVLFLLLLVAWRVLGPELWVLRRPPGSVHVPLRARNRAGTQQHHNTAHTADR